MMSVELWKKERSDPRPTTRPEKYPANVGKCRTNYFCNMCKKTNQKKQTKKKTLQRKHNGFPVLNLPGSSTLSHTTNLPKTKETSMELQSPTICIVILSN